MRLLIDECLPRDLKRLLAEHECSTAQERGWSGKSNGALLSVADKKFNVLLTADQGFEYEQTVANRRIAVLILAARSNQIEDLTPIIPEALAALRNLSPGLVIRVGR